jgi:hypothetical protein
MPDPNRLKQVYAALRALVDEAMARAAAVQQRAGEDAERTPDVLGELDEALADLHGAPTSDEARADFDDTLRRAEEAGERLAATRGEQQEARAGIADVRAAMFAVRVLRREGAARDPEMLRAMLQGLAEREARGVRALLDELVRRDPWWDARAAPHG